MANRRFEMYEYRQVIFRMRMGQSDRTIAKSGLMGRLKCAQVRAIAQQNGWLEPVSLPEDDVLAGAFRRKAANPTHRSLIEPFAEQVIKWRQEGIWGTTIHQALVNKFDFTGSYSCVRRFLKKLEKDHPQVTCMLEFEPGEAAQVDFGKGPTVTDAWTGQVHKTWIFVMTLCFSRHMYAEIVTDQKLSTWLACHRRAFEFFNGIPSKLIIDNPKCAITRACFRDPEVQRSYGELAEGYGFLISPCPPRDPKKKGRVEAGVKYVKNNFVPLREFRSLVDANAQLRQWLLEVAGNRIHGTTRQKPLSLFSETEKHLLRPLPDVPPQIAVWAQVKVHGNCHVQFEKAYYSAPFRLVRQSLWLKATDNTVKLYRNLQLVAVHPRLRRPGLRSTMDEHLPPEALAWKMQDPQWCLRQAEAVGANCLELVQRLFNHGVLDNLRAVQGVIGLKKKYGAVRLEAACCRALFFDDPRYRTVKGILQKGLDQHPLHREPEPMLSAVYTAEGRFLRPNSDLQVH
jgi:transposase